MPVSAGESLAATPGVEVTSSVRGDRAKVIGGREVDISGVEPTTIAAAYRFEWDAGSDATVASLGEGGAIVRKDLADDKGLAVGDTLRLLSPAGTEFEVVVRGVYEPAEYTLVLAVFERTRELGMLRAIGMTRRQTRRMIRQEGVITVMIGAALGMPLGIALAALVTQSVSQYGVSFSLPVVTLVVFAAVAVLAGILAAVAPARRASRLNVLKSLQYE